MGWEGVVHGGEEYLIDEGYVALFFDTALVRCVSGEGQGPVAIGGTAHVRCVSGEGQGPDAVGGAGHLYYITLRKYA